MLKSDVQIIAEVKTHSPFGWNSDKSWDELFGIANEIGDMLSIHTDPRWHGSFDLLKKARSLTDKPILAKGIHEHDSDIQRALDCGADFVLVVGRIPEVHLDMCMLEPLTVAELSAYPKSAQTVWNSRNLKTGGYKDETFTDARANWKGWLCQASNIATKSDVNPTADAIIVGTHLIGFAQSLQEKS